MALYQPTNCIPSSFTQGTVDVNDNMEISWQVNGNSAMTAFQIDFYLNDYASTPVASTGKRTDNCPFYGTDRFGRPQIFTWNSRVSWEDKGFTNGNEYKYKITQWYEGNNYLVRFPLRSALTQGVVYYFKMNVEGDPYYNTVIYFTAPSDVPINTIIYVSLVNNNGWFESGNDTILLNISINKNGNVPPGAIILPSTANVGGAQYNILTQTSSNEFITRQTPTLTLYQTDENYKNGVLLPNSLATSIGYFQAKYEQEQGDPIRWIRWQVATANNGIVGDILQDTGDIYTPTLNYEFNGFFNGQQYAIRCLGKSESGQATQLQGANADGWIFFNINIENQGNYIGNFTARCLHKENATLLKWDGFTVIPGTTIGNYTLENGKVMLETNSSVVWDKVDGGAMNFATPWMVSWKGEVAQPTVANAGRLTINGNPLSNIGISVTSPDGNLLLIVSNGVQLFKFNGSTYDYLTEIKQNGVSFEQVRTIAFSLDGSKMVVGGNLTSGGSRGYAMLFSVNGDAVELIKELSSSQATNFGGSVQQVVFTSDLILVGGSFRRIDIFSLEGNYNSTIWIEGANVNARTNVMLYAPSFSIVIVSGSEQLGDGNYFYYNYIYKENNQSLELIGELPFENETNISFGSGAISSDSEMLVLNATSYAYFWKLNQTNASFLFRLNLVATGSVAQFSPDGKFLLLGSGLYSTSGVYVNYIQRLSNLATSGTFSPTSTTAIVNGVLWNISSPIQGKIFEVVPNFYFERDGWNIIVKEENGNSLTIFNMPSVTTDIAIVFSTNRISIFYYCENTFISSDLTDVQYTQNIISQVAIYGGNLGSAVDNVTIFNGSSPEILANFNSPSFEPEWNSSEYQLYMSADFAASLEAGSSNSASIGFRVYRNEIGKGVLMPIATLNSNIMQLKDYGIVSRKAYKYSLYAYDSKGAFMIAIEADNVIATSFQNYSLLVCDYDEKNDEYHVRKQYLFALNPTESGAGNNNSPTLNANFTRYPTRMPSTQNYASGTLQGLIGAIYTVPALIEQIGNYKWTAKPSTLDYFDSVDLEKELYDLSTAPYQLFLRDMKGRLRMIATNSAITMTTNIKQKQQSISISFPWVEIGDASDVTIIQTPDDYGWNNDNQVLDVQLDVDIATGELSATYPFPYNGTKFYLTGVNKETLTAKTPLGVTPAQFELSETATQPDDGEVTATAKVNSEDN